MTLARTLAATCDHDGCTRTLTLDPLGPQPWHFLTSAGWSFDLMNDAQPTFCPDHRATPTSRDDGADECRGDSAGEWREDVADNTDFNHQSQIERHEA